MPVDPSNLDAIVAAATKRFGGVQTISRGIDTPQVKRISWGSPEMDLITWGGAPMGRMIRPWGAKSSFKTLMVMSMAAQAQQYRDEQFPDGLTVAYYNVEGTFDEPFTRRLGVDTEKLILVNEFTNTIEDVVIQLQGLLTVAHIHIIDSVGFITSRERVETVPGAKMSRASKARAWSDLLPDIEGRMDKQENMIVFIDQVRVHQQHGHEINSSSAIFDHASAMDLHHRRTKSLYLGADGEYLEKRPQKSNVDTLNSDDILIDAVEFGVELNKSKVCRPFGKARLRWDLNEERFDRAFELKKIGIFLGVIQQSGSFYTIPTQTKSIQGERKLCQRIEQDEVLAMQIFAAVNKYSQERIHRLAA